MSTQPPCSKPEVSPEPVQTLLARHPSLWRAHQLGHFDAPSTPSGHPLLDEQLPGGGWPSGVLTELLLKTPGIGELRFLVPVLQKATRAKKKVIWLAPPHTPFTPALQQFGIQTEHLLIVQAPQPADRLWAIEQTLRSDSCGVLLAWLPEAKTLARPEHLRRLQMAAGSTQGLTFLFRPFQAQYQPSPAPLRLLLAPVPPWEAQDTLQVHLIKRRGPTLESPLRLALPKPDAWLPRPLAVAQDSHPATSSLPKSIDQDTPTEASVPFISRMSHVVDRAIPAPPAIAPNSTGPHTVRFGAGSPGTDPLRQHR